MKRYKFVVMQQIGLFVGISLFIDGQNNGTMMMTLQEWDDLSFMMLGGIFQDNEAKIEIEKSNHLPAFIEGE